MTVLIITIFTAVCFFLPETNHPPVARTAGEITVVLPSDGIILDGHNSTDDKGVVGFKWTQIGYVFTRSIDGFNPFIRCH